MENNFNEMAEYINSNKELMDKLGVLVKELDGNTGVKENGKKLLELMDNWDKNDAENV